MSNVDATTFGAKLRDIRIQKGFSLRQVSIQSKIGKQPAISPSYWSLVERGQRNIPKIDTLKRMANGLREDSSTILQLAGLSESDELNVPDWATEQDIADLHDYLSTNKPMNYEGVELDADAKEAVHQFLIGYYWKRRKQEKNDAHE